MIYDDIANSIKTDRLLLRPFTIGDTSTVVELCHNRKVSAPTLALPYPYTENDYISWFNTHSESFNKKTMFNYAVTLKSTNELIGSISVSQQSSHHRGELGYWIGEPYWNKGYASEAAKAILYFAFNYTSLNRVFALFFVNNTQSERVMQKIGMTQEGLLKQHMYKDGIYYDIGYYAIVKEDYLKQTL